MAARQPQQQTPVKIAIIGSGIAGLAMAYYLTHPEQGGKFEVTIYESHHRLGLDSQSITFEGDNYADGSFVDSTDRVDGSEQPNFTSWSSSNRKETATAVTSPPSPSSSSPPSSPTSQSPKPRVRVDMPLRVFSTRYYPHLTTLLESLGVRYRSENYQASFGQYNGKPIFKYKNFVIGPFSIPYVNPMTLLQPVTRDIIRFLHCAPNDLRNGRLPPPPQLITTFDLLNSTPNEPIGSVPGTPSVDNRRPETLLQYLIAEGYSEEFIYHFEIPTVSSICTCSYESAANYPAYIIIQYQALRSGSGVRRVDGGINQAVERLSQYITHVKCNTAVTAIRHLKSTHNAPSSELNMIDCDGDEQRESCVDHVEISDSNNERYVYNHIIFATQANQTCKILYQSLFSLPPTPDLDGHSPGKKHHITKPSTSLQQPAPENWYQIYDTLAKIPYESSELILHGDERFLPPNKENWCNVNFLVPDLDTVKAHVLTPTPSVDLTPTNLTPEETECGISRGTKDDLIDAVGGPMIVTPSSPTASLLPEETIIVPSGLRSPTLQSKTFGTPGQSSLLPDDLAAPNLSRQFSDNWLLAIERQPSARAQRHALVMNTKMVSQEEGMSTIWMNKVQPGINPKCNIFQTWNPFVGIIAYGVNSADALRIRDKVVESEKPPVVAAETMGELIAQRQEQTWKMEQITNLYGRSFFQRPVVTFDSITACSELWSLNGKANIWSIGSFALGGVPLLESGVASAYVVAQKLGAKPVMKPTETVRESLSPNSRFITSGSAASLKDHYPILGWVNTASSTNHIVELIIGLIYWILYLCGAYARPTPTRSNHTKQD